MDDERFEEAIDQLPALPTSVARLAVLLRDPDTPMRDVQRVLETDPALATVLLRLANAPYFGLPRKVESVRAAMLLLGTRRIFELAVSAAYVRVLPASFPGYQMLPEAFWRHCLAVATLADELGRDVGGAQDLPAFTAGLLHDVGKLAADRFVATVPIEALVDAGGSTLVDAERATLATDHAELGGSILERWGLPESIVAACRWHHAPSEALGSPYSRLVDVVHAANGLAHVLGFGADLAELAREIDPGAVARLGLTAAVIEGVAARAMEEVDHTAQALGSGR